MPWFSKMWSMLSKANSALGTAAIEIDTSKMQFGEWHFPPEDLTAQKRGTLDTGVDQTDASKITGVRVEAGLGVGGFNSAIPALLGRVIGRDSYNIAANATAFLGFEGGALATQLVIPIAVDCCVMGPGACEDGYCAADDPPPPNPCELDEPQDKGKHGKKWF